MFSGVCYSNLSKVCPFQNNVSCSIRYCFRSLFFKLKLFSKIFFSKNFRRLFKALFNYQSSCCSVPLLRRLEHLIKSFGVCQQLFLFFSKYFFLSIKSRKNGERGIWTLAPVTRPTPLAGAPLQPLEYFSGHVFSWRMDYYNKASISCQQLF